MIGPMVRKMLHVMVGLESIVVRMSPCLSMYWEKGMAQGAGKGGSTSFQLYSAYTNVQFPDSTKFELAY